jgi:Ca-activated chloride channel family protein
VSTTFDSITCSALPAKYAYPLRTEKFTHQPVESLAISMDIKSKRAIKTIYSPSHDVEIVRKDDYHTRIS